MNELIGAAKSQEMSLFKMKAGLIAGVSAAVVPFPFPWGSGIFRR